jgi:hypothetical protein
MKSSRFLINKNDNSRYIFDYYYSDILLRVFTIFCIVNIIIQYNENIKRPDSMYEPIIWLQKLLASTQLTQLQFYILILLSIGLCIITIFNRKIIYRILLFLLVLYLNTIKWNYNFFSHVGHLLILAHFFTIPIPIRKGLLNKNQKKITSNTIKWSLAGVLITYSMAGFWKISTLIYKLFYKPNEINWLSEDAVELNSIVNLRTYDETLSNNLLAIYKIPYIWEISTLIIFFVQLFAVFAVFNKKISYFILIGLVTFHIYTTLFLNIFFYTSAFVLIILLFPYHLIFKKRFEKFNLK